ncbi:hypothetical protein M0R19_05120 [Candidatus Pacearchaeota archaeon]|jgi:uncharacterized membrane protein YiaA|nr:hypothetical protein [Candidatus Pacearchaeota archaeon]
MKYKNDYKETIEYLTAISVSSLFTGIIFYSLGIYNQIVILKFLGNLILGVPIGIIIGTFVNRNKWKV